ncbi:MAG: hypothetical protein ACRD5F_06505 [Candidatus Acidiferrales bacterium]
MLDRKRTDRRGMVRERLRPYLFVIGSLMLLIVVFALLGFTFARYYVDQRERERKEGSQRIGQNSLLAELPPSPSPATPELVFALDNVLA